MNKYADFISKQQKDLRGSTVNTIDEAAKEGSSRYSSGGYIQHVVVHKSGKDHVTMTHGTDEPGAIAFHGSVDGHKIRVDTEGSKEGSTPSHADFKKDLMQKHPNLPKETHDKVMGIIKAGMKKHGYAY